jgi:hypothetical protein
LAVGGGEGKWWGGRRRRKRTRALFPFSAARSGSYPSRGDLICKFGGAKEEGLFKFKAANEMDAEREGGRERERERERALLGITGGLGLRRRRKGDCGSARLRKNDKILALFMYLQLHIKKKYFFKLSLPLSLRKIWSCIIMQCLVFLRDHGQKVNPKR